MRYKARRTTSRHPSRALMRSSSLSVSVFLGKFIFFARSRKEAQKIINFLYVISNPSPLPLLISTPLILSINHRTPLTHSPYIDASFCVDETLFFFLCIRYTENSPPPPPPLCPLISGLAAVGPVRGLFWTIEESGWITSQLPGWDTLNTKTARPAEAKSELKKGALFFRNLSLPHWTRAKLQSSSVALPVVVGFPSDAGFQLQSCAEKGLTTKLTQQAVYSSHFLLNSHSRGTEHQAYTEDFFGQ